MSIPAALYGLFGSVSGITDLLGSGDNLRFYPAMIPQGVDLPAARYTRVAGGFERSVVAPITYAECTYQVDVVADDTYVDAEAAAHAIRVGIDGYTGPPIVGERFHNIIIESMSAPIEQPPEASERWRWVVTMDVRIFHVINIT